MQHAATATAPSTARLFEPLRLGGLRLAHRVVMAPLTRMRATVPGNAPNALNAEYYGQRASEGGLIITEATQVDQTGQGYPATPGIHSAEQVAGWRGVVDAVHRKGGLIVLQLWHVGRISHPSHQPGGAAPISPSAVRPTGKAYTATFGQEPFETPRALETAEIPGVVAMYRRGAENARAAGFDGVEIHGANGYLVDQFLRDRSNRRTDAYGGSIENRSRFAVEVAEAVSEVWGADRVGIRLSPFGVFNDMGDSDPVALFTHVVGEMSRIGLAYVHLIEPRQDEMYGADLGEWATRPVGSVFRAAFSGPVIAGGGYDGPGGAAAIAAGDADAIAFGRWFISNPDLPSRLRVNGRLNPYHRETFYGGGEKGYTDYPAWHVASGTPGK